MRLRGSLALALLLGAGALPPMGGGYSPAPGISASERANADAPTVRDNLQKGQRTSTLSQVLKQLFRGGGHRGFRGWKYSGQPTTVAAEKRKAQKRRNRLRHKARCKGKRA